MGKDQGDGIILKGTLDNLTRVNNTEINRTFEEIGNINNLILAVEIDDLKGLLLEAPH